MDVSDYQAPGRPGIAPRWTSSAKTGVGAALHPSSRVWFTISHGILNEIYYPRVDQACIRDLGLIVTDGREFFSEEKRHTVHQVGYLAEGVPAYSLIDTCEQGRYQIEKKILTDPRRVVALQHTRFVPLKGALGDYHLYVLLSPHLGNRGYGNTGWVGDYKGVPILFAERGSIALALACSLPWLKRSVGFVGISDGWQDLRAHKQMTWIYDRAEDGNVALTGEVNLRDAGDIKRLWPMVRRAARFLTQNGPVTQEDRWEEDPGYSPFTLAVEIAALLAAADIADLNGSPGAALYLRETADAWNASIERWTYVTGTELSRQVGVEGYYVRITSPEVAEAASPARDSCPSRTVPPAKALRRLIISSAPMPWLWFASDCGHRRTPRGQHR